MYTIKNFGLAGILGVSLLTFTTGLAASPPDPALAGPDADAGSPPRRPGPEPAKSPPAPADSIITPAQSELRFRAAMRTMITPWALQRLVLIRTSRPARSLGPEVECMAKVVYHEAANQALPGQLAVAQVILNRVNGGGAFARTACAVVNQKGQFFRTRHFKVPAHDRERWRTAVAIADLARDRRLSQVAPGALFYHASFARPAWRRQHQRIAQVGDQVFYR